MTDKNSKLIKGAAILGIAGVVIKVLGAVFRIPLTNWIGADGMSYYGVAYAIYGALVVLATAGIPVAISRLVSESISIGHYKNAHKVFKVATGMLFVVGIVCFLTCFFGGDLIANAVKNPGAAPALRAISPALLFVPIFSAFRGYFQGRQNMNPTAISEITEQLARCIVGLTLAYSLRNVGMREAAAGASFGASAGSIAGLGIIFIIYLMNRKTIHRKITLHNKEVEETNVLIRKILTVAIPIIIGCEIMPIMTLIDTGIIMRRLQDTGWSYEGAKHLYGLYSGFCNTLIALPQMFTQAVAVSLVPAIAAALKIKEYKSVKDNIALGYRMTMIMAFPCAVGMFALAEPILRLLYKDQQASAVESAPLLMVMCVGAIFLAITQTSTGVLQSIGKQMTPVKHLALGCVGKVVITWITVGFVSINAKGAAIGTIVAYLIALILNNRSVKKYTGVEFDYVLTYVKPFIASAAMGICAFAVHKLVMIPLGSMGYMGNALATLLAIGVGILVYVVMIFVVKAIRMEDMDSIPGGNKLKRILERFMK